MRTSPVQSSVHTTTHTRPYPFDHHQDANTRRTTYSKKIDTPGSGSANGGPMIVGDRTVEEVRASRYRRPLHKRELVDTRRLVSDRPMLTIYNGRTGFSWPYHTPYPRRHKRKSVTYSTYCPINLALRPRSPVGRAATRGTYQQYPTHTEEHVHAKNCCSSMTASSTITRTTPSGTLSFNSRYILQANSMCCPSSRIISSLE